MVLFYTRGNWWQKNLYGVYLVMDVHDCDEVLGL